MNTDEGIVEPGSYVCPFCPGDSATITIPDSALPEDDVFCDECGASFGVDMLSYAGVKDG